MIYNTERRNEIIKLLSSESDKAFTTEEICERILTSGGKSTVYRIISELTAKGIIKKLSDSNTRHVRYQYLGNKTCSEHLHLKCKVCGRLIHLDDVTSHILEKRIFTREGFALDGGALIYGSCEGCRGGRAR